MDNDKLDKLQKATVKRFYDCVLDDTLTGFVFKFQRDAAILHTMNVREDNDEDHSLPAEPVEIRDIFGHEKVSKKTVECECYVCHRFIAASRFAPHLEKCIGIGRSSRQTRSRTAAAAAAAANSFIQPLNDDSNDGSMDDKDDAEDDLYTTNVDDNDEEWSNSTNSSDPRSKRAGRTRVASTAATRRRAANKRNELSKK